MLFDPDAGRSLKEIYQRKWEQEWSEPFKARILAVAEASSCSWWEIVFEAMEHLREQLEDPIERARFEAATTARLLPFGPDPRLGKEGDR
jgi:hypothetical protein